jgi:apolipoprotein N-acyltransferase
MARAVLNKRQAPPARPISQAWGPYLRDAVTYKRWPLPVLAGATGLLLPLIFAPGNIWPLAYVCLVPWLIGVVASQRRATMFLVSYGLGVLFFFFSLNWLWPVTVWPPQGIFGIQIPIGTLLLGLYLGLYFPLAAWLIRFAYKRLRAPLALAVPVVWVATDLVRAYLPVVPYDGRWQYTGLQWFFLAHSHYNVLPLIQVADVAGAYGVSFLIAAVNGWLAELICHPVVWNSARVWTRRQKVITAIVAAAMGGDLAYGVVELNRGTLQPGPRVAVIQTDQPLFVESGFGMSAAALDKVVWNLLDEAVQAQPRPDIVVLPETMWPYRLNREFREMVFTDNEIRQASRFEQERAKRDHERLKKLASDTGATIVVGSLSLEHYPERPHFKTEKYNSVLVYRPGEDEPERYDKIHLVLFGEFIPFRRGHLHWFYNYLNGVMPWTEEYSLTAGTEYRVFETQAASQHGRTYHFGSPICYEITMSDACRRFAYGAIGKRADLLINLSNDGWFFYKSELPQHLAVAVFRAVENRVGLVRSVNTGISAAIDPKGHILEAMLKDGRWRERAEPQLVRGRWRRNPLPYQGLTGVLRQQVPVDPRVTLYMRWGNWLPIVCMVVSGGLLLAWWVDRTWIAVRHIRRGTHGRP